MLRMPSGLWRSLTKTRHDLQVFAGLLYFRKWGLRDDPQNRALLVEAGRRGSRGPKLTEAEAEFLETVPDLFKTTEDEFFMATEIVERSLIRRVESSR